VLEPVYTHTIQLATARKSHTMGKEGKFTRTTLRGCARGVCRVAAAGGVAVLDVLHALCLVRVREPVLAHVQVVAEAAGRAGHEDLGDGEGGHGCDVCGLETCGRGGGVASSGWIEMWLHCFGMRKLRSGETSFTIAVWKAVAKFARKGYEVRKGLYNASRQRRKPV
jgi:hypothetical protein